MKVSIVLPTYNGEKWLGESIQSVIDQTFSNWELIIVNDCSTDNTLEIANFYKKKDNRIKVISNSINKKLPASLNIGFEHAQGEYWTWTSDDNLYKPNAIDILVQYLDEHPSVDLVSMNFDFVDEHKNFLKDFDSRYKFKRTPEGLLLDCNIGAAFMYRQSIAKKIGAYDDKMFCAEDYDYWIRIALKGTISYTNDNIYIYRLNQYSLTSTKKDVVKKRALEIRQKYAEDFFSHFSFTKKDNALFWFDFSKEIRPNTYLNYYRLFYLKKFFVRIFLMLFFWNKKLKKKIKHFISVNKRYSFSKRK